MLDDQLFDLMVIRRAIPCLPNLHTIKLSTHYGEDFETSEEIKRSFQPGMVLPASRDTKDDEWGDIGIRPLQCLMTAVAMSKIQLKTLLVDLTSWEAFDEESMTMQYQIEESYEFGKPLKAPPITFIFCTAFEHLTKLRLKMAPDLAYFGSNTPVYMELGKALQSATELEEVSLEFGDSFLAWHERRNTTPLQFEMIFGNLTWKRLKDFSLSVIDVNEDFLVDFVHRHSSTIQEFDIESLWLLEGDWASTFRRLKEPLSKCKTVHFGGRFGMGNWMDESEILLPMGVHMLQDGWTPDEDFKKKHLGQYLREYFKDDGPFPLKSIEELENERGSTEQGDPISGLMLITVDVPTATIVD
jgi:hypothetical protein